MLVGGFELINCLSLRSLCHALESDPRTLDNDVTKRAKKKSVMVIESELRMI